MKKYFAFCLLIIGTLLSVNVFAAKRYWVATSDSIWNSTRNWAATSGGTRGASVPGSSDTAYFDSNSVKKDTFDVNVSVMRLEIASGYTGTILQRTFTLTIGTSGATLSGGTFSGGSASITSSGAFVISGCSFTSTSGTFSLSASFTVSSGSFTHNSGKMKFTATSTVTGSTGSALNFSDLEYAPSGTSTFSIASGSLLSALGTITISGSAAATINGDTLRAKGDVRITNTSTGGGGNTILFVTGTANQGLTGNGTAGQGRAPNIVIDKSGGTLTISSVLTVNGDWIYQRGTVNAGTSTVGFIGTFNLDGQEVASSNTMSFYKIIVGANTRTLTGNLDVDNTLSVSSGATMVGGSYTINAWSFNATGTWTYNTSTVILDGTGYAIIKGTSTINFYNLTFNHTSGSVTLQNPVKVNNSMTFTKGHVKTTSTNILELIDNATNTGGGQGAYVCGPMRKTGNDAFTFPLGDTTLTDSASYHPLAMTAPSSTGDQFDGTYFPSAQAYGTTLGSGIASVSSCEYWTFKRVTGSSTPTLTLGWNYNCDNSDYSEMRVALWNGTQWNDLGGGTVTVSNPTGTAAASSASSFTVNPAPVTIGFKTVNKGYSLLSKSLDGGFFNTDGYELYFSFKEEYKDADGLLTYSVTNLSNNTTVNLINSTANHALVSYGNNQYKLDLYNTSNTALSSGYYQLEVTNEKNEKWYLRFKI